MPASGCRFQSNEIFCMPTVGVDKSAPIPAYFESKITPKWACWAIGVCYCTILGVSLLDTCTGVRMNSTMHLLSTTRLRVYLSHQLTQNVGSVQ